MPRLTWNPSRSSRAMRFTMRSRLSTSFEGLVSVGIGFFGSGRSRLIGTGSEWFLRKANDEQRTADIHLSCGRLPHRSFFDVFVKLLALKNSLHVHAGSVNHVRIQFARLNQMFDFGDRNFRRSRHHGIEVACGFAIDEISPCVALPGLHEGEVGFERAFHDVGATIKLSRLFSFRDHGSNASRSEKGWYPRASSANPFGERSLRNQFELHGSIQHHLFEHLVFADVGSDMSPELSV